MNSTFEEAIANAGTTVLSRTSRTSRVKYVTAAESRENWENAPEGIVGYPGPYNTVADPRNLWTGPQDTGETIPQNILDALEEQIPDVPPVAFDPTSYLAPAAGGSASFSVTMTGAGVSGSWTVEPDAAATWLHLVSPPAQEEQTEDGQVLYNFDPNGTGAERAGYFYINGQTFTVNQPA